MRLLERIAEELKKDWKMQTFTYDYISHLKKYVVVLHVLAFILVWLIAIKVQSQLMFLPLIGCFASWDFFVLFDSKRRAFKDSYKLEKYEFHGTLWSTIGISALFLLFALK